MSSIVINDDASVFERIIAPHHASLTPDAARSILAFELLDEDRRRMRVLAGKAQEGVLSPEERTELDCYERVGCLLGILHSKARRSLKTSPPTT